MTAPKHILLVEPADAVREVLTEMLESRGYRVTVANGGEAMRRLLDEANGIAAVVLDATLKGETASSLAQHAETRRLPVVMISGRPDAIESADAHHLQLLQKPFRLGDLVAALDKAFASGEFGQRDA
jgi:two-component system OmpR family response regulator